MQIENHCLNSAIQIPSPNFDLRTDPEDISLLVIHCISLPPEQFAGDYIDQLFCNQLNPNDDPYFQAIHQLKVSAHLLIRRDGSIKQYVPFNCRAWHAGVSSFQGRERCNDFSIGIELEGSVNQAYTDSQYQQLALVTKALLAAYPRLSLDRITGHSDIAPERKDDPGRFLIGEGIEDYWVSGTKPANPKQTLQTIVLAANSKTFQQHQRHANTNR